jgi:metal-dependent HD superfamily phosphatase/phosphodiesterase
LWTAANVNAMERLQMSDHGPVHVKIVMNIAVRMLRLLVEAGIEPSIVTQYEMDEEDAEVVVTLAALLHDVGMSVHRADHEAFSLFLAHDKLKQLLPEIYSPRQATIVRSEILHAIISHRSGGRPLTLEAGVVRIADALDMAKGRSRIPFEAGSLSIHSVSAAAIEGITLRKGKDRPICITVEMSNSAGVFQLDQLFREKLKGSGLEAHLEVKAKLGEEERSLLTDFTL